MTYNKTTVAAIVWVMNIAALFIYIFTYNHISKYQSKIIHAGSGFATFMYIGHVLLVNTGGKRHRAFLAMIAFTQSVYFLFIMLYYQFGVDDYKSKIGVFLLTEFITGFCIIKSGLRSGLFKNEQGML